MLKFSTYFYTTAQSNTVFHSLNESVFEWIEWASDSTVHSDGLTCFVSDWISRFERIDWFKWFSKSFIKTETCCHLLGVGPIDDAIDHRRWLIDITMMSRHRAPPHTPCNSPHPNTVFGKKMTCTTEPLKGIITRREENMYFNTFSHSFIIG